MSEKLRPLMLGMMLTLTATDGAAGGAFTFHAHGEKDYRSVTLIDTCTAFRCPLEAVIAWMRDGSEPHTFSETRELLAALDPAPPDAASAYVYERKELFPSGLSRA